MRVRAQLSKATIAWAKCSCAAGSERAVRDGSRRVEHRAVQHAGVERSRRAVEHALERRPGTALAGDVYKACADQASAGRRAQAGSPEAARPCSVYWAEYETHRESAGRTARGHPPERKPLGLARRAEYHALDARGVTARGRRTPGAFTGVTTDLTAKPRTAWSQVVPRSALQSRVPVQLRGRGTDSL